MTRRHPLGPAAAVALLAVLGACGMPEVVLPVPTPERATVRLDDDAVDALGRILMLEDHRRFDRTAFWELVRHPEPEVRRRAVTAAGRIGDADAAPILIRVLAEDPSAAVRADVAFALGLLGDTSRTVVSALRAAAPARWTPVRPEETTVVVEIVAALGRIGTRAALDEIEDALLATYPGRDEHSRRIAAEALLAMYNFPRGAGRIAAVARFMETPDPALRWRAAWTLFRLRESEASRHLVGALDDPSHRVRAYAARGLTARLADSAGVRDTALARLTARLDDPHPHVRINAVGSLASYGDDAPVGAMARLLADRDANVAIAAAGALARREGAAAERLAAVADDPGASPGVRGAAVTALATSDPARAARIVEGWTDAGFRLRYQAARSVAALDGAAAIGLFRRLIEDPDPRVAVAALEAIDVPADSVDRRGRDEIRAALLRAADGGPPPLQAAALSRLGPLLRASDAGAVLDVYAAAAADPARRTVAMAAIQSLRRLADDDDDLARGFFARFPAPSDPWLRRAAASALGDGWGDPPAAVASPDPAFYRDAARTAIAEPLATGHRPTAVIRTAGGEIEIELATVEAPLTVMNFAGLAEAGYFDGGVWHRVIPNFVLQDGAPAGSSGGGPGWSIRDEINRLRYDRGVLGMALSGPDTGGSQWFITHSPQPHLDGGYTIFGRVVGGMDVADRVVQGDAIESIRIRR